MSKLDDLTGKQFGRLTVIKRAEDYICPNGQHMTQWICECSCEEHNIITVLAINLKRNNTQSCGCLQKERAKQISQSNRKKIDTIYQETTESDGQVIPMKNFILILKIMTKLKIVVGT